MKTYRIPSIFIIGLLFILGYGCVAGVRAAETIENIIASVDVNPVFTMSTDVASLNFGQSGGGTTAGPRNVALDIESDHNNEWSVSVEAISPLTSGAFTIPNNNFRYSQVSGGNGVWNTGAGYLDTLPHTFYTAAPSEYITSSVTLTLVLNVDIPQSQTAGLYATSIVFTLRDTQTFEEFEQTVYVTVEIPSSFSMSAQPSDLNFSNTDPGTATETKTLYIACAGNSNRFWSVNLGVISELTSGSFTIPNENFHWAPLTGEGTWSGTWDAGTGHMDTVPHTFYNASVAEKTTEDPVELMLQLYVDIPVNQIAGTYTTTLVLTMTE